MKKRIIFGLILIWLGWHLAQPINLALADIGRHIKNGELILQGVWDVLYKNYYSYNCPDYPFINHHWLFGVFAYLIWHWLDFVGLALIYILINLVTFSLFVSRVKNVSFVVVCAFSLLAIPLISARMEIRPEAFSLLFFGLMWCLSEKYAQERLKTMAIRALLIVIQILWVNTHIYFMAGPLLMLIFLFQAKIDNKPQAARFFGVNYLLLLGSCLINPSGLAGALVAFRVTTVGYPVIEEQNILYMLKNFPDNPVYAYTLIAVALSALAWGALIYKEGVKRHFSMFILMVVMSLAALKASRFIGPYGFFWVPLSAYAWGRWMEAWDIRGRKLATAVLLTTGILAAALINFDFRQAPVLGLSAGSSAAADFFKREGLTGPIFSNYENGGYLIFHLSPQFKFFVDNRVEAFPVDFFQKMYIPMQMREDFWQVTDRYFHFNVIFFSRNDQTLSANRFITRRINDPSWALVFMDNHTLLLLKRNSQNIDCIRRCELKVLNFKEDRLVPLDQAG